MPTKSEVLTLLREAAELEHQLMIQYLFAAYSLKSEPDEFAEAPDSHLRITRNRRWRDEVLAIAREEMGHLITVQQVILSLSSLPHFDRDSFPISAHYYPFQFKLERLTPNSLAKYLWTEKPMESEELTRDQLLGPDRADIETEVYAHRPNELGRLYKAILGGVAALPEGDFDPQVENQTDVSRWPGIGKMAIVERISDRKAAVQAIESIVEQGEGHLYAKDSHFHRFLTLYREFRKAVEDGEDPARNVANNPNTAGPNAAGPDAERFRDLGSGRITAVRTLRWARLFNKRYAVLLAELTHALMLPGAVPRGRGPRPRVTPGQPLDDEKLRAMSGQQIVALTLEQLMALTATQVGNLSEEQTAALTARQLFGLRAEQVKGFTSDQVRGFTEDQVLALSPVQIEALDTGPLESLSRDRLKPLIQARREDDPIRKQLEERLATTELLRRNRAQLETLIRWVRDEMTLVIAPIAKHLTHLSVKDPQDSEPKAGAPFELDSTGPTLPRDEKAQWCAHQRLIDETRLLLGDFEPDDDPLQLLTVVKAIDRGRADYTAEQLTRVTRETSERADRIAREIEEELEGT